MLVSNQSILARFSSVNMGSSILGPIIDLNLYRLGSISVTWIGTPTGTFVLQLSNEIQVGTTAVSDAGFDDVPGSSLSVTAAGQQTWTFTLPYYARWFRLKYTATSSTGTITVCNLAFQY